jgi:hypothetical protein
MSFFNIIQKIIQTVILLNIIKGYVERKYNVNFTNVFISVSYNIIYVYSKCQILFIKLNKTVATFIESNPSLLKISNDVKSLFAGETTKNSIEFIKNGEIIKNIKCKDFNCDELINAYETDYDFLIYSDINNDNCANKIMSQKGEEITVQYELSRVSFLLVELQLDNTIIKIDLKNEKYNFYIEGNVLSLEFFTYYLKNIYFDHDFDLTSYDNISLHIIDQDVNTFELDLVEKNHIIKFEKDSYAIIEPELEAEEVEEVEALEEAEEAVEAEVEPIKEENQLNYENIEVSV